MSVFWRIQFFSAVWLCLLFGPVAQATAALPQYPSRSVLVINSYHAEFPWVVAHNNALREALRGRATLSFFHMDTKRTPRSRHHELAEKAFAVFQEQQPDVVVLTDDDALKHLGNRLVQTGTPVVYLGINGNPREYLSDIHLSTGVLQRPLFRRSVAYLRCLYGDRLKRCLLLLDSGTTSSAILEVEFHNRARLDVTGIELDIQLVHDFDTWQESVLAAREKGYDLIILGLYHTLTDVLGQHVPADTVARWTGQHADLPLFAFAEYAVGQGKAIGGLVYAGAPQGEEAAKLVLRILDGERPTGIAPVTAEKGRFVFSRHELSRWGLTLPDGPPCKLENVIYVE